MSLSLLATTNIPFAATPENPLRRRKVHAPLQVGKKRVGYTTCEHKQRKEGEGHVTDRRNVLLGLGGLYGATATIGTQEKTAIANPVQPPDLSTCHDATDMNTGKPVKCCPPYTTAEIYDFVPPSPDEPLRVRKPVHMLTNKEKENYKEAIRLMKALEPEDPWNYYQQATVHCTFCNGAFNQVDSDATLQVHGSWLFLPWHRFYIYFWEKILGSLINEPTFAIPYWNWDDPEEMRMPLMYLDESSPLYNDKRDKNHYSSVLDYNYAIGDPNPTPDQIPGVIASNLCYLNKMYNETKRNSSLFMGKPLSAGTPVTDITIGAGALELLHNVIHEWTGPTASPNQDMGNFSTAARDTMFFGLHANVDRMWDIYSTCRGNKPDFKATDFLKAAFIFYDENKHVVKVKVKDCLNPQQLRYTYSPQNLKWKGIGRKCRKLSKSAKTKSAGESVKLAPVSEFGSERRSLTEPIRALVTRPKVSRSKDEKEEATEAIIIEGIEVAQGQHIRFDVYVTKPIEGLVGPYKGELAGSFVHVPHTHQNRARTTGHKTNLEMGITSLLEDIDAEASDKLVVTLVPRLGEVTVGGVRIDLLQADDAED